MLVMLENGRRTKEKTELISLPLALISFGKVMADEAMRTRVISA